MKRIGILTQYYKSRNYGGVLQAFALCYIFNQFNVKCEQISYKIIHYEKDKSNLRITNKIKAVVKALLNWTIHHSLKKKSNEFDKFLDHIPHSKRVYTDANICEAMDDYDIFVSGSDQVWNFNWFHEAYFLTFIPKGIKSKYSYAASTGGSIIDDNEIAFLKRALDDYKGVSVRELDTSMSLNELLNKRVEFVLDPTLLLEQSQWENFCPACLCNDKYIFCYFLGNDSKIRNLVSKFAKSKSLKIVTIPFLSNSFEMRDIFFGDEKFIAASPLQFVSLIKDADYIFTDSFHASVFSCIFKKQFFTFMRKGHNAMSNRIETLCELFNAEDHFCNKEERIDLMYLLNVKQLNYNNIANYNKMKAKSEKYIKSIVEDKNA